MDLDSRREFLQQLATAVELYGLPVGDRQSVDCINYTAEHLSCRGCSFEKGCATYATVIWNMLMRKRKDLSVTQEDWDAEIDKQASLALAGIIPQKEEV